MSVKLVFGVGVCDIAGVASAENKPYYRKWSDMLKRCYSEKYLEINKSYKGHAVCDEWLLFSNFKRWMVRQDWKGKHLDKDLLHPGNKVYRPEACLFITQEINKAIINKKPNPYFCNKRKVFMAQIGMNGKKIHLGCFKSRQDAIKKYNEKKKEYIESLILKSHCANIAKGLKRHLEKITKSTTLRTDENV